MTPISSPFMPPPPIDPTPIINPNGIPTDRGGGNPIPSANINPYNILPIKKSASVLSPELISRFRQFQAMQRVLPAYQSGLGGNLPALLQWGMMRNSGAASGGANFFPPADPRGSGLGGVLNPGPPTGSMSPELMQLKFGIGPLGGGF